MQLKTDPEFRDKIPPLTAQEFQQLEDNIVKDGKVVTLSWCGAKPLLTAITAGPSSRSTRRYHIPLHQWTSPTNGPLSSGCVRIS